MHLHPHACMHALEYRKWKHLVYRKTGEDLGDHAAAWSPKVLQVLANMHCNRIGLMSR